MLLGRYLECAYDEASPAEQRIFAGLLEIQDPQLYAWLMGREMPPDPAVADVVRKIGAGTAR